MSRLPTNVSSPLVVAQEQGLPPEAGHRPAARPRPMLGPWDILFRILHGLGVLEIISLAVALAAHPNETGIIGQGLVLRAWLGLVVGPMMLLFGSLIAWRLPGHATGRLMILLS